MKKVNKQFVSEIDKKLAEFDRTHAPSASQKAETQKYERIFKRRDNPVQDNDDQGDIWQ